MVSKTFKIINDDGVHMRPANVFVSAMTKFKSDIKIIFKEKEIDGKSIMNIMASCIKCGDEITVVCNGNDEKEMIAKAQEIIENGFNSNSCERR